MTKLDTSKQQAELSLAAMQKRSSVAEDTLTLVKHQRQQAVVDWAAEKQARQAFEVDLAAEKEARQGLEADLATEQKRRNASEAALSDAKKANVKVSCLTAN